MIGKLIEHLKRRRRLTAVAKNFVREGGLSAKPGSAAPEIDYLKTVLSEVEPLHAPAAYIATRTDAVPGGVWDLPTWRVALVGGATVTAAACGVILLMPPAATEYATIIGQTTTVELQDGSEIFLSGNSSVTVRFSRHARAITLNSGEVTFDVAHNPSRPFSVDALSAQIAAVGTEFNVSRRDGVEVDVLEGRVLVSLSERDQEPVSVSAGNRAVAILTNGAIILAPAETARIRSLQQGRLYFDSTPLAEAFEEFEAFSPLRARFTDETLAQHVVSGSFDITGVEDFILSVEQVLDVKVRRNGRVLIVSASP